MKKMNLALLALTTGVLSVQNVQAKNIPVCSDLSKEIKEVSESYDKLINDASKLSEKGKHCKAARKLQQAFSKDSEKSLNDSVEIKILESLSKGKYLNDFMNFSISIRKMNNSHPQAEYMDYLLTKTYQSNINKEGDNQQVGNLTKADGTPMSLIAEARMIHKDFLKKHPTSTYSNEVSSALSKIESVSLKNATANFDAEMKALKNSKDEDLLEFHASRLAQSIEDNNSTSERKEALYSLYKYYKDHKKTVTGAKEKMSEISGLLTGPLKSKSIARKVKFHNKLNKIEATNNKSISQITSDIVSESSINNKLLSKDDLKSLIKQKKGNDKSFFLPITVTDSEKAIILRTLGVVGVLMAFDRPLMDFVQNNRSDTMTAITDITNNFGDKHGLVPLVGASYTLGLIFKNDQLKRAAVRSLGAAVISGLTVEFLKAMTHRARPRNNKGPYHFEGAGWSSDNTSFPSGHSAGAWSVMTVFATEFQDTKIVPIIAYSMAAMGSFARVYKNAHWFSDVTLGALIGWMSGKLMYKLFKKKESKKLAFNPVVGEMNGASVTIRSSSQETLKSWPVDLYNYTHN